MIRSRFNLRDLPDALARVASWHRRGLAAVAAFFAVLFGVSAVQPPAPPTVSVIVAARALPAGTTLTDADLRSLTAPVDLAPVGALRAEDAVGRVVHAPVAAGSILTSVDVATGQALAAPGRVVVAVKVSDAALIATLKVGTEVDLFAAGRSTPVASRARVVAEPGGGQAGWTSTDATMLVEVPQEVAGALAEASAAGAVTIGVR